MILLRDGNPKSIVRTPTRIREGVVLPF